MELDKVYYTPGLTYNVTRPNIFSIEYMRKLGKSRVFKNNGVFLENPLNFISRFDTETIKQDYTDMKLVLSKIPKEAGIRYIRESLKFSNLLKDTFILNVDLLKLYLDKLHGLRVFVLEEKVNIYSLEFINYYLDHEMDRELFTDLLTWSKITDDFLIIEHWLNSDDTYLNESQAVNYILKTIELNKKLNELIVDDYVNYNLYMQYMECLRDLIIGKRAEDYDFIYYGTDRFKDMTNFYLGNTLILELANTGKFRSSDGNVYNYRALDKARDRIIEDIKEYLINGMTLEEIKTFINVT